MLAGHREETAMTRWFTAIALAFAAFTASEAVAQQQFPNRPVRILVTIPPGGAPDIAARLLAEKLADALGQNVVVDNRTGANGNVAGDLVAKAAPDGHTLLLGADSLIAINPHVYGKMPFDTLNDLVPVTSVASNQFFLAVNPGVPVKTLPELVEHAKKAASPLHYASGGHGSQHQLGIEMFKQRAGINLIHVPYRGGRPAGIATVSGETQVMLAGASSANLLRSGKLRGLATTGKKRSPLFPDLPTIGEFYPGYDVTIWLGLFAPKGTPEPIVAKLRAEAQKALSDRQLAEKLNVTGSLNTLVLSPADFSALIRADHAKYGKVVKEIGIKIE
jgi:tripartite-type tricarboxylate transporter receptor subunit TctC